MSVLRNSTTSPADSKAVLCALDLGRSAQCFSLHASQRLAAVGLLNEIRLVRIDIDRDSPTPSLREIGAETHEKQSVHVLDLAWSPHTHTHTHAQHRLAACYSNGEIKVFSLSASCIAALYSATPATSHRSSLAFAGPFASFPATTGVQRGVSALLQPDWVCDRGDIAESKCCVRLCWHPVDTPATLYCGCVDGTVRAYVTERERDNRESERDSRERERDSREREREKERERERDGREKTPSIGGSIAQREREREFLARESERERDRERDRLASRLTTQPALTTASSSLPHSTKAIAIYRGRRSAVRDLAFSPFNPDIYADCSDSGIVRVWDRRERDKPLLTTRSQTHKGRALALAWCPYRDGVLASGGSDKAIKVWDTHTHTYTNTHTSTSTHTAPQRASSPSISLSLSPALQARHVLSSHTHSQKDRERENKSESQTQNDIVSERERESNREAEPELLSTLYAQGEVSRLLWGFSLSGSAFLLSCCADTAGSLSLWSEDRDKRHVPLCVLRGHGSDVCVGVAWIDVPLSLALRSSSTSSSRGGRAEDRERETIAASGSSKGVNRRASLSAQQSLSVSLPAPSSVLAQRTHSQTQTQAQTQTPCRVLLSLSRDGRLLLQSPPLGYRPWEHLPRCALSLSAQGDCALSRDSDTLTQRQAQPQTQRERERELVFVSEREMERERERESEREVSSDETNAFLSLSALYRDPLLSSHTQTQSQTLTVSDSYYREREGESRHSRDEESDLLYDRAERSVAEDTLREREKGRVWWGNTGLNSLGAARALLAEKERDREKEKETETKSERDRERARAAEGSVFDPAMISLLAKNYSFAPYVKDVNVRRVTHANTHTHTETETETESVSDERKEREREREIETERETERGRERARRACTHNLSVARSAGLNCRAALWAAVLAALPARSPSALVNNTHNSNNNGVNNNSVTTLVRKNRKLSSSMSSLSVPLLTQLLKELQQGGDAQHFVAVCEVLRAASLLSVVCKEVPLLAARRLYLVHTELLTRLQLHHEVCALLRASEDEYLTTQSRKETEIAIKCAHCRKEVPKRLSTSNADSVGTAYCVNCKKTASMCSFCMEPVRGLLQWCVVCAHGGHLHCMQQWFAQYACCPAGCGHDCGLSCCGSGAQRKSGATATATASAEREKEGFVARDAVEETLQRRRKALRKTRARQLRASLGR